MPALLVALNEGPNILVGRIPVMVGRHSGCDARIGSFQVSRQHCCLAESEGAIANPKGLDIEAVMAYRKERRSILDFPGATNLAQRIALTLCTTKGTSTAAKPIAMYAAAQSGGLRERPWTNIAMLKKMFPIPPKKASTASDIRFSPALMANAVPKSNSSKYKAGSPITML